MEVRASLRGSLSPQSNIRSNWSWRSFVRFGPTADASMPMHLKMGSSEGAFFLLLRGQWGLNKGTIVHTHASAGPA